ncbi:MAG: hypothetical protein J1F65_05700 [Clostridiales bacterium]|nr:hypothetical protein [Clostridiales bacterium]
MKSKAFTRVISVAILLVVIVSIFAGCSPKFESGAFGRHYRGACFEVYSLYAGVKSSADTFTKDDVTLDFYYGLYDIDDDDPSCSIVSGYDDYFFAIYVYTEIRTSMPQIYFQKIVEDYQNVENAHFIKEISREESLSEDYAYQIRPILGLKYNHHESLTLPQDLFTDRRGFIHIAVVAINTSKDTSLPYIISNGYIVDIDYEFLDDNMLQLS